MRSFSSFHSFTLHTQVPTLCFSSSTTSTQPSGATVQLFFQWQMTCIFSTVFSNNADGILKPHIYFVRFRFAERLHAQRRRFILVARLTASQFSSPPFVESLCSLLPRRKKQPATRGGLLFFSFFLQEITELTCATVYYGICTSTCLFIVM